MKTAAGAMTTTIVVGCAVGLLACGAGGEQPFFDAGTVDGSSDASGCVVAARFTPTMPVAPAVIVAEADVLGGAGVFDYQWMIRRGGAEVPFIRLDAIGRDVQFEAPVAGVYTVMVTAGGGCTPSAQELNVGTSGANLRAVRMRFVPPPGMGVPPQERTVQVPGGTDYSLGTVVLDPGLVAPVMVRTAGGLPVTAYLRFTSRATPDATVEAWSTVAGTAEVRLTGGHHDVLVVPFADLAPQQIVDWDPAAGVLTLDPSAAWSGTVVDAGGAAIAGARVSVTSGGVPSTVAVSDAAGNFLVRWRDAPGPEQVTVVPPNARGLPRLDVTMTVPAAAATIRYASVTPRALGGVVIEVGGAPAIDAGVSLRLTLAGAATVETMTAMVPASGSVQLLLHTGPDGRLPTATAIAAPGQLFVDAAAGAARSTIDLTAGVGATLAAAPALAVTGQVVDHAGLAVAGARVRAVLDDALGYAGAPVLTATTDAGGGFALALAPGQPYALSVTDPSARRASVRITIVRQAAGALAPITLGKALRVSGEVRATGIGAPLRAVGVAALCQLGCTGLERDRPLGEAVTDFAGRFAVAVPDPGVTP